MTLYEELELTPNCSVDDIKHQYRTLARIHHPDLGGDEEKFKRIKFAYEVLSDPVRRKQYDETNTTTEAPNAQSEAIQFLLHIFNIVMPHFDPNSGNNLIDIMKAEIDKESLLVLSEKSRCEQYIKHLELTKDKLKLKDTSSDDVISSFINDQLSNRIKDFEIFEYRLSVLDMMTDILNNYQYGFIELINEQPVMENEVNMLN